MPDLEEQRVAEGDTVEGAHFDKDSRPLQIFKVLFIQVLVLAALTLAKEEIKIERGAGGAREGGKSRESARARARERERER